MKYKIYKIFSTHGSSITICAKDYKDACEQASQRFTVAEGKFLRKARKDETPGIIAIMYYCDITDVSELLSWLS